LGSVRINTVREGFLVEMLGRSAVEIDRRRALREEGRETVIGLLMITMEHLRHLAGDFLLLKVLRGKRDLLRSCEVNIEGKEIVGNLLKREHFGS